MRILIAILFATLVGCNGSKDEPCGAPDNPCPVVEAVLRNLTPSVGTLTPSFDPNIHAYSLSLTSGPVDVALTPEANAEVVITINGSVVSSGAAGPAIPADFATKTVQIQAAVSGGDTTDYSVAIDRSPVPQTILTENCGDNGHAGAAVAMTQTVLVVGAPACDEAGDSSPKGAALVYRKTTAGWTLEATLRAPVPINNDLFGQTVAIEGDLIAVGAVGADNNGLDSGAVHLFRHDGTLWNHEAILTAKTAGFGDLFGQSIAFWGDWVVVGAPGEDSTTAFDSVDDGINIGAVYVFQQEGSAWSLQTLLKPSPAQDKSDYGHSITASGTHLAVGAPGDRGVDGAIRAGTVALYESVTGTIAHTGNIILSDWRPHDQFGTAVAMDGTLLAVGAPYRDEGDQGVGRDPDIRPILQAGSVYTYRWDGSTWNEGAILHADSPSQNQRFGHTIAVSKDRLLVGSTQENTGGNRSGAAWLFLIDENTHGVSKSYLKSTTVAAKEYFGSAVAITETDLVLGAEYGGSNQSGIVHIFE